MGNSKIVYYGETLIDLTGDTVEAAKLLKGVTAHDKKGEKITGTLADVTQATPAITVDAAGKITASATQAAGVVAAGTKSATKQLPVQAAKTVTPSASAQTAVAKGVFTTGIVTVAAVYAVISVTYPSGSTCTCTSGSKTLTAKDTTGKALFVIPAAGTWTVKAVKGSQSASKAVSITAEGQVATVTLAYNLVLFNGTDNTTATGGWTFGSWASGGSEFSNATISNKQIVYSQSGYGGIFTKKQIDVTNYKTLTCDCTITGYLEYAKSFGVSKHTNKEIVDSNGSMDSMFVAKKTLAAGTYTGTSALSVDVSKVTGNCSLGFGVFCSLTLEIKINNVQLK